MLHILLMFALYALYVLLPMIPAVLIYRLFPNTAVTVSGPLANLTINASGAFAAYVVTVALGYGLVSKTDALIAQLSTPTVELTTDIQLRDNAGREPSNVHALIKDLRVEVYPPAEERVYPRLKMRLPLLGPERWPTLVLHVPGFQDAPIYLDREVKQDPGVRDSLKSSITLKRIVVLEQLPPVAAHKSYTGEGPAIQLVQDGPPPTE
jgi:hypothetical protein